MGTKIAINARLDPGSGVGGVESVLIGLVRALGQLTDGDEEYLLLTSHRHPRWLDDYIGSNQRIIIEPTPASSAGFGQKVAKEARRYLNRLNPPKKPFPSPRISSGFIESLGCDVVHFPYQYFEICSLPSIYNPHDLQHRHFPQFFSPEGLAKRDVEYRAGCEYAHTIVAGSQWVKDDLCRHYHVHPSRVTVIPWAPPTQAYAEAERDHAPVAAKFGLPQHFAFYPAMLWPHKNHLRLLEALAYLKDKFSLVIHLVCTGARGDFWPTIESAVNRLELQDQVKFLGIVSREELQALYGLCNFVVVPTLFEAASGPVFEAWNAGAPVACSNVTSLPQQVGKAALVFDPYDVTSIAHAMKTLNSDLKLKADLIARGHLRLRDFSWERTARAFRAVYRRAARRPLTEDEEILLSHDWMSEDASLLG